MLASKGALPNMEGIKARQKGVAWRLIAAALTPFAAISVYLLFTRWPSYRFTAFSDYAGLVGSVLIGAAFMATLPIRLPRRIVWLVVYIPVFAALTFFFTLLFIAAVFHEGL